MSDTADDANDNPLRLDHDWFPMPVPANVRLGPRSWLYSTYALMRYRSRRPIGLTVGHDTGIYIESRIDVGPDGQVEIGDYCTLAGPIISTNGRVTIGSHVLISREVVIADRAAATPPDDAAPPVTAEIVVGDNAWIGSRAILLAGARIGDGAIVGAATVVDFEVPPHAIVAGNPAKVVGWAKPRVD